MRNVKKMIQRLTPFWGSNFGPQNGNPERKNESLTPFWGPKFGPQNGVSHQGRFAGICCLNFTGRLCVNVLRHVSNLRAAQLKLRRPLAAQPVLGHEIDPVLGFEKRASFAADCCVPAMVCWLTLSMA